MTKLSKTTLQHALIVAGLAAGLGLSSISAFAADTMPTAHSDGLGAVITDTTITAHVKAKLMGERGLKHSEISVTTVNGVATLTGRAKNADAKSLAEESTKTVDGVKSVDNQLLDMEGQPMPSRTHRVVAKTERVVSDSWITTKVKSEILANSVSKGFDVSVDTSHGTVTLSGALPSQHAIEKVTSIAERVHGVKSVNADALTVASK